MSTSYGPVSMQMVEVDTGAVPVADTGYPSGSNLVCSSVFADVGSYQLIVSNLQSDGSYLPVGGATASVTSCGSTCP